MEFIFIEMYLRVGCRQCVPGYLNTSRELPLTSCRLSYIALSVCIKRNGSGQDRQAKINSVSGEMGVYVCVS